MNGRFDEARPVAPRGNPPSWRGPGALKGTSVIVLALLLIAVLHPSARAADTSEAIREYQTAVGLLKQGELRLARRQYRNFLNEYPDSNRRARAYFGLAETYYLEDEFDSAAHYYQRSLEGPDLPDSYRRTALERGFQSARRGGSETVQSFARRVAKERSIPLSDTVHRQVYRVLERGADDELSLQYARKRTRQRPDEGFWKYKLGVRLAEKGQFDRALRLLDELGEPGSRLRYNATYTKAEIQLQQGKLDEAEYRYRFLLQRGSHVQQARYGLAWVAIKRSDHETARDHLERLTREAQGPTRLKAARDLARLARRNNHRDRALDWYFRAIEWAEGPEEKNLIEEAKKYAKSGAE